MNINNRSGEQTPSYSNVGSSPMSSQLNSARKKVINSQKSAINFKSFSNEISIFGGNEGAAPGGGLSKNSSFKKQGITK